VAGRAGPRRAVDRFLAGRAAKGQSTGEGARRCADLHAWAFPEAAFDVVADIFTQFSTPEERVGKWASVRRALKPGGLLILQGYTPKQLQYGTGGPKQIAQLYTRAMLEEGFAGMRELRIVEEEREMQEGAGHSGMSAVIGLTARK
jgi:hypothetical protein